MHLKKIELKKILSYGLPFLVIFLMFLSVNICLIQMDIPTDTEYGEGTYTDHYGWPISFRTVGHQGYTNMPPSTTIVTETNYYNLVIDVAIWLILSFLISTGIYLCIRKKTIIGKFIERNRKLTGMLTGALLSFILLAIFIIAIPHPPPEVSILCIFIIPLFAGIITHCITKTEGINSISKEGVTTGFIPGVVCFLLVVTLNWEYTVDIWIQIIVLLLFYTLLFMGFTALGELISYKLKKML